MGKKLLGCYLENARNNTHEEFHNNPTSIKGGNTENVFYGLAWEQFSVDP